MTAEKFDARHFDWTKDVPTKRETPYLISVKDFDEMMGEVDRLVVEGEKVIGVLIAQRDKARKWNKRIVVTSIVQTVIGLIVAYFLSGCAYTKERLNSWDWKDSVMEAGYATMATADIWQTKKFGGFDNGIYESNPLLGKHPSKAALGVVLFSDIVVHFAISLMLPDKLRPWFQTITTTARVLIIGRNCANDKRLCIIGEGFY